MSSEHIDWEKTSKETCIEIIQGLCDEIRKMQYQLDERAVAMRETGDMVRSLYQGSEVSKRIIFMQGKIEGARLALWNGKPEEALEILNAERPS